VATSSSRIAVYASVGADLTHYDLDVERATLVRRGTVRLPAMVQYVWPHVSRRFLYAATSSRGPGQSGGGNAHHLTALRVDPRSGTLAFHGDPVPLAARPIHLSTDVPSTHALVAYNNPSTVSVHRIAPDGHIGAEVAQAEPPKGGIYAHQVRVDASNRTVLLVARGNDAEHGRAEDPGSLEVFDYRDGALTHRASVAPGGGYGFGPRHLDFHPTQPWVYVSIERQNQLIVFRLRDGALEPQPAFVESTIVAPPPPGGRQMVGTVHVHPNGRFVYVANRAYGFVERDGRRVSTGGENGIAVFAIDPSTGAPTRIQNIDTRGFGTRTFTIDPSGRLLVAGNLMPLSVPAASGYDEVPASLALFRIGDDGRLEYLHKVDVDAGRETQFWSGLLELPAD